MRMHPHNALHYYTLLKPKRHYIAPLSRFRGSHITTAHEQQCCRFQSYAKTAPSWPYEIDKAWTTFLKVPGCPTSRIFFFCYSNNNKNYDDDDGNNNNNNEIILFMTVRPARIPTVVSERGEKYA